MSQSSNAKKIRRELNKRADAIEKNVALDIIEGLYRMPFLKRLKWAWKIVRGVRTERDRMLEWSLRFVWWLDELFETITRMGQTPRRCTTCRHLDLCGCSENNNKNCPHWVKHHVS